jgi:hypothetical protein
VARRHRYDNERLQVGLEQVLDALERGDLRAEQLASRARPSALGRIADEIRKTFEII